MHHQIIKSVKFFQHLLFTRFHRIRSQIVDTLLLLSVCHLFGLYNPNQVSDALARPKAGLYRDLHSMSQYYWKCLNVRFGCTMALDLKDTEAKSASTQSRRCITISVDDSNVDRYGKTIAYCSNWWSKKHNNTIWGQNILGITIKIGDIVKSHYMFVICVFRISVRRQVLLRRLPRSLMRTIYRKGFPKLLMILM